MYVCVSYACLVAFTRGHEIPRNWSHRMVVSILVGAGSSSGRSARAHAESPSAVLYLIVFASVSPTECENVQLARLAGQRTPKLGLCQPNCPAGVTVLLSSCLKSAPAACSVSTA